MTDRHSQTEAGCQTKEDRNEERERQMDRQCRQMIDRGGQTEETEASSLCID